MWSIIFFVNASLFVLLVRAEPDSTNIVSAVFAGGTTPPVNVWPPANEDVNLDIKLVLPTAVILPTPEWV